MQAERIDSDIRDPARDTRRVGRRATISERLLSVITPAAALAVGLVSLLVLVGWWRGVDALVRLGPALDIGIMIPGTAFGLLLVSVSLWLLRSPVRRTEFGPGETATARFRERLRRGTAHGLAALAVLLGVLSLLAHLLAFDPGPILQPFRKTVTALVGYYPGHPSLAVALTLLFLGLSLLLLDARSPRVRRWSEWLAGAALLIALQALIGHSYGEKGLYAPRALVMAEPAYTPLGLHTALATMAAAVGVLFARPNGRAAHIVVGRDTGSYLVRRLLPAALVIAVAFGWLSLIAHRVGLHGREYRLSLLVIAMIVLLAVLINSSARAIRRVDAERTRALNRLSESESMFRAIFDNAGIGIGVIDPAGRAVATNRALQEMLGYDALELAGRAFVDFTHPDDAERDWTRFRELMLGQRGWYRAIKRFKDSSGGTFWGQLSTSVARDAEGRPIFGIGMVEDITERKRAEDTQRRLTAILEATPDFVGIADAQGRALYVNSAGRTLTGLAEHDVAGLTIPDFHPAWAARRVLEEGLPAAAHAGAWTGETALLSPHGEEIPVSQVILAHRNAVGQVEYYSTVMRDITERMRTESAQHFLLEASRAFSGSLEPDQVLRSITELMVPEHADYCVVDLIAENGSVERVAAAHADPAKQRLMERLRQQAVGTAEGAGVADVIRTQEPLVIPEITPAWQQRLSRNAEHLAVIQELAPRSLMIVPLFARARLTGAITFGITQPGRRYHRHDLLLAQELAGRAGLALENARLFHASQQATRIRDEVLRVVAHDLRNPLNTISLTAGLLHEQMLALGALETAERLTIIERSVERADRLIGDLLDVAKLEAGKLTLDLHAASVAGLVREAIELQHALATQRGITLEQELGSTDGQVMVDRHRVLQVFSNLLSNALKFSPEGSRIVVRGYCENGAAHFSVSDQGPGISDGEQRRLFDPFWQASKDTGGAGLGLAIARGIVEAHGGRIWVESRPGEGTTFCFTLPRETQTGGHALAAD